MDDTAAIMLEEAADVEIGNETDFLAAFDEETEAEDMADASAAEEETEEAEGETAPEEEAVEAPQTIAYNFNRKTTELPLAAVSDIAAALGMEPNALVAQLQKGGNYDAMYSVMQRQQPYAGVLDRFANYAQRNGFTHEDAANRLLQAVELAESAAYAQRLREAYPDAPQQLIRELAMRKAREEREANVAQSTAQQTQQQEDARKQKWVAFFNNHAAEGITADKLSERMLNALRDGEDPETVYMAEKNANLEKQLKELQQKQLNAKRSSGSAKTTASAAATDDFMLGFFS